eukprot:jgi/Mesvir1/19338/Mv10396-RA.1
MAVGQGLLENPGRPRKDPPRPALAGRRRHLVPGAHIPQPGRMFGRDLAGLNVSNCEGAGDVGVGAVAARCHQGPVRLVVSRCRRVTDACLSSLAQECGRLDTLYMDETGVTDAGVGVLAQNCPRLGTLVVSACHVTDASVTQVGQHCPMLEHLGVERSWDVTNACIKAVAVGCPGLTRLDASYCSAVGSAGISALAEACSGLLRLDLGEFLG